MEHLKLLLNLISRTFLNKWRSKNGVYLVFTCFVSIYFASQLLSTSGVLGIFLHDTSESNIFKSLTYFFHFIFILWIIAPLFFGIKLSAMREFSQFQYLPIEKSNFVIVNNIMGLIGVGPIITLFIVYSTLFQKFDLNPELIFPILFLVLIFITISGTTSFLINHCIFNLRYFGSILNKFTFGAILTIGLLFLVNFKEVDFFEYLYMFLPSNLLVSGIRELLEGNLYSFTYASSGLCLLFILANFLYSKMLRHGNPTFQLRKLQKRKYNFLRSYFYYITRMLNMFALKTELKMLVAKDIIYFTKNARLIVWNILQIYAAYIFFSVIMKNFPNPFNSTIIMISFLGVFNLSLYMNLFAFDSSGFQSYFIYPTIFRNVFLSKNIANLFINNSIMLLSGLIVWFTFDLYISGFQLLIMVCLYSYSSLIAQSFGNIFSIYFVMNVPFNQSMGMFNPLASIILSICIVLIILIPSILIVFLNMVDEIKFYLLLFSVLLSICIYIICLKYASVKLSDKRMIILNELI